MDNFFIAYRDPLFGIIILCAIVFIISFANYWWGVFKNKEEKQSIEKFVKKFEIVTDENEYKKLLEDSSIPVESLALLAHAYGKSGDHEKAINIYLVTLKRVKGRDEKQYLLSSLGKIYFKAGFLRRSAEVFLESLRLYPRNEESLKYLTVAYEQLQEFDKAEEVLNSLEELGVQVDLQRNFLRFLAISKDATLLVDAKIKKLKELSQQTPFLKRRLFELLREYAMPIDEAFYNTLPFEQMMDILWYTQTPEIPCHHELVKQIRMAKGEIPYQPSTQTNFTLDTLAKLRFHNYSGVGLSFEYLCTECKQIFPMHFYRCPHCQSMNTVVIQASLTALNDEENNSFL